MLSITLDINETPVVIRALNLCVYNSASSYTEQDFEKALIELWKKK